MHALIDLVHTVSYKINRSHYRYRNQSEPIELELKGHNLLKMKFKH